MDKDTKKNGMLKKIIITFIANGLGLYLATKYVSGVNIPLEIKEFSIVIAALTAINLFIRPFIKLIMTPIIILTFGVGIIFVNAATLYILEFLLPTVTIDGLTALILTSLVISAVSLVIRFSAKAL